MTDCTSSHADLRPLEECRVCFWQRPSKSDEHNERLRRETEQAIRQHPNTRREDR